MSTVTTIRLPGQNNVARETIISGNTFIVDESGNLMCPTIITTTLEVKGPVVANGITDVGTTTITTLQMNGTVITVGDQSIPIDILNLYNTITCAPGSYCAYGTPSVACPVGYYCPGGPSAPIMCPIGTICDQGSSYPVPYDLTIPFYYISTYAGSNTLSYKGDGGQARNATFHRPYDIVIDTSDNLYTTDLVNNVIRKIDYSSGTITTIAGDPSGQAGFSGDGGVASKAVLHQPSGMTIDSAGNLYFCDSTNNVVRKIDHLSGIITTIAGDSSGYAGFSGDQGPASKALLNQPTGIIVDCFGNLFITDTGNHCIRVVIGPYGTKGLFFVTSQDYPPGTIITIAGTPTSSGYSGDGDIATNAQLNYPSGLCLFNDNSGLVFCDTENHCVRFITPTLLIMTIAGIGGNNGYSGDGGLATRALLYYPIGISVDEGGNLFCTDYKNNRIRRIDTNGFICTIAGNGTSINNGDDGVALYAGVNKPLGIIVSPDDSRILCTDEHSIRVLTIETPIPL